LCKIIIKRNTKKTSPNFYFQQEENQILNPLKKANKRGSSASDWLKAYQAVKHNRAKNLNKGNIKHLIRALAALYLFNLYYKGNSYDLAKDSTGTNFDLSVGAEIFSIKSHFNQSIDAKNTFQKNPDFDECTYIITPTESTKKAVQGSIKIIQEEAIKRFRENIDNEIIKQLSGTKVNAEFDIKEKVKEIEKKYHSDSMIEVAKRNIQLVQKSFEGLEYEAILNKQQF
jgi:hypothetical protein